MRRCGQLGIPYTVFEQDAAIDARPRDWSFGVYWAQSRLGECLPEGIDERFLRENVQVDDYMAKEDFVLPFFNGGTGELMKNIPTPFSTRLQRRKFLKVLSQDMDIKVSLLSNDRTLKTLIRLTVRETIIKNQIRGRHRHSYLRRWYRGARETLNWMRRCSFQS